MAIGFNAMTTNTAGGSQNLALGNNSLDALTSGDDNVAIGYGTLTTATTGGYNTAVGTNALDALTTGNYNTAVGQNAMSTATDGDSNTGVGQGALYNCAGGAKNTTLGYDSGNAVTSGDNNLLLGYNAGMASSPAHTTNGTNRIVLGDNNITHAYIKVDWTVTSDERDKMNFAEIPHGLSFVNDLKPIKFDFKKSRDDETPHGTTKYGFKAQDILTLEGDNPIIINNQDEDKLGVINSHLMPVLVKAIQELSAEIEILKAK